MINNLSIKIFDVPEKERNLTGSEYTELLLKNNNKKVKQFLNKINGKKILFTNDYSYFLGEVLSIEKKNELSFLFNGFKINLVSFEEVNNKTFIVDNILKHKIIQEETFFNNKLSFFQNAINSLKEFSNEFNDVAKNDVDYSQFLNENISLINVEDISISFDKLNTTYSNMCINDIINELSLDIQNNNDKFNKIKDYYNTFINKIIVTSGANTLVSIPLKIDENLKLFGSYLVINKENFSVLASFPLSVIGIDKFKEMPSYITTDDNFNEKYKKVITQIINTLSSYNKEFSILLETDII